MMFFEHLQLTKMRNLSAGFVDKVKISMFYCFNCFNVLFDIIDFDFSLQL